MRVEGLAVAGREGRHPVRLGHALVLEERVEVAVDHFPQNTVHAGDASRSISTRPGRPPRPIEVRTPRRSVSSASRRAGHAWPLSVRHDQDS